MVMMGPKICFNGEISPLPLLIWHTLVGVYQEPLLYTIKGPTDIVKSVKCIIMPMNQNTVELQWLEH